MADRKMSVQQRRICEFLMINPGATSAEIMSGTDLAYDSVKKKLRVLKDGGHVAGSESNYRSTYQLTGKPFPRLADYRPSLRYRADKARLIGRHRSTDQVFDAMHAMVSAGRDRE